jgi:hypothetical protein
MACLLAADGLRLLGKFVSALGGRYVSLYTGVRIVSFMCVALFILALAGKLPKIAKWVGAVCLLSSAGLMLVAPALFVKIQIIGSLLVALVCLVLL